MPTHSFAHVKLIIRRHKNSFAVVYFSLNHSLHPLYPNTVAFTYPHISGRGTHHGRCWGGHDGVGEGREGVLVSVLVGVLVLMLVLMLVLVELSAQVGRRAQRGAAVGALGGQETGVELLAQKVLFWRRAREKGGLGPGLVMKGRWLSSVHRHFHLSDSEYTIKYSTCCWTPLKDSLSALDSNMSAKS